ncbi:MAG TPA: hypothetical protein G4O11_10685 [Anaerolineae bacterium]|nr:hypothetical protein [Anaerolineae bacterium]
MRLTFSSRTLRARSTCRRGWGSGLLNIILPQAPTVLAEDEPVVGEIAASASPSRKQDTSVHADPASPSYGTISSHGACPAAAGPWRACGVSPG